MNKENKKYILEKLALLPDISGVYFMKNYKEHIIYIGKAKSLKRRVASYFSNSNKDAKTTALVEHINDFDYIVTENEIEALILEAEMIQKHRPHYNILLKDQKSFPFIAVTNEMFPRVIKARNVVKSGLNPRYKKYYGPYVAAEKADNITKFIHDTFKLRRCKLDFPLKRAVRPCLYYHIGKCSAPCANMISEDEYNKVADNAIMILEGNVEELAEKLELEMKEYAKKLEFEKAKELRDQINLLQVITVQQSIYIPDSGDKDIIGIYGEKGNYVVAVLSIKDGKLMDRKSFSMLGAGRYNEVLYAFFTQYYSHSNLIPSSIVIDFEPKDRKTIEKYLKKIAERPVTLDIDRSKRGLIHIANENAKHLYKEANLIRDIPLGLTRLREIFHLKKTPSIIESFDIAHIQGSYTMAGMVRFVNGVSDNKNYRVFNIKTVIGIDDFGSIKEAVYRRYKRLKDENIVFPDIILIDGGRGQLNSAIEALRELNISKQPVMALAKKFEEIYLPNRDEPVRLPDNEPARLLLQKVRDETHRFVNTSHSNKRSKEMIKSELEGIKGVGYKTIERLYMFFDGIDNIKKASLDDLEKVPGINLNTIHSIYEYFHKLD